MKRTHIIFVISILLVSACASQTQRKESVEESVDLKEPVFPDTRWTYQELPDLTNEQRIELALQAQKEGDAYYESIINKAEELSERLETYIYQWLAGEVDAELPDGLLPPYIDSAKTHTWKLVHPDEITPEEQWYAMKMYDPTRV